MHHIVLGTDTGPHGLSTIQSTNDKDSTSLLQRESCDNIEPKLMINLNDFVCPALARPLVPEIGEMAPCWPR